MLKLLWPPWVCLLNVATGQVCWVHHKVGAPADLKCTEARPWELKRHVLCCSMLRSKFNVIMHCSMLAVTTQLSMSRSASLRTWRPAQHPTSRGVSRKQSVGLRRQDAQSRSIVCESSLPQLCKSEVLSTRFDDYTRTARLEQQLQDLFFCCNVDLSWFVHQLRMWHHKCDSKPL